MTAITREQAIKGIKKAYAAKDYESVEEIAAYIDTLPPVATNSLTKDMLAFEDRLKEAQEGTSVFGQVVGAGNALVKGLTFGASDEIVSGVKTVGKKLLGDDRSMSDIYDAQHAQENERQDEFAEGNQALALGAEISGAILSPINKIFGAIKLGKLGTGAIGTTATMATQGAAAGGSYVFLDADGSPTERLSDAFTVAVPSALFGVVGGKVINVSAKTFKKVYSRLTTKKATTNNTATLKESRDAAYQLVKDSEIKFSPAQMDDASSAFVERTKASLDYDKGSNTQKAVINNIQSLQKIAKSKEGLTLGHLDKAQQALWRKHKTAKAQGNASDQQIVMSGINSIDDLIKAHPDTGEIMQVARHANSQYRKAQTFDDVVSDIKLDESYKGVNSVDQLKAAVVKILKNPKQSKFYSDSELSRFREFVADEGSHTEKALRSFGKMAPTTALHHIMLSGLSLGSGFASPMAALGPYTGTGLAHAAKGIARSKQKGRNQDFLSEMQGNPVAPDRTRTNGGMLTGVAASDYNDQLTSDRERKKAAR